MRTSHSPLRHQAGMVLIISFIILLLLSIIGVSGMKVTGLEEKMAGNDRDQSIAFQAAEAALRTAEARVVTLYNAKNIDDFCTPASPVNGLFYDPEISDGLNCDPCPTTGTPAVPQADSNCDVPNPMDAATWTNDAKSVAVDTTNIPALTGSSGRYYITYHYYYRNKGANTTVDWYYFTMTARGAGAQGGEVVLRSYFGAKVDIGKT